MKGQAYIISDTMIDILKNIITIATILGIFLLFSIYHVKINEVIDERMTFDAVNSIIGDKCLIYEDESGNFYRSIFDDEKLNQGNICLNSNEFEIEISDFETTWKLGTSQHKKSFILPITIYSRGKFKFGKMVISY